MAQDDFLTLLNDILSEFIPLFAFFTIPFILLFGIHLFTSIVRGGIVSSCSTSTDKKQDKTKKRKIRLRPNEYGEFDYDYSKNNFECEGCK